MLKVKFNNVTLSYDRRGRGIPLVLLHGYPLDHSIWDETATLLDRDFNVISPDLRGFGESDLGEKELRMSDYAHDLAGLLDALNIQKTYVVGHSMGGYIALAFARAYSHRMLGLALVASQAFPDTSDQKEGRYRQAESIIAAGAVGVAKVAEDMPPKLTADLNIQRVVEGIILRQHPKSLAMALRAMANRPDSLTILSEFAFPLKLIHGTNDALIPLERAQEEQKMVVASELYEINGAGHMPMMERPGETAEAVKTFLD